MHSSVHRTAWADEITNIVRFAAIERLVDVNLAKSKPRFVAQMIASADHQTVMPCHPRPVSLGAPPPPLLFPTLQPDEQYLRPGAFDLLPERLLLA